MQPPAVCQRADCTLSYLLGIAAQLGQRFGRGTAPESPPIQGPGPDLRSDHQVAFSPGPNEEFPVRPAEPSLLSEPPDTSSIPTKVLRTPEHTPLPVLPSPDPTWPRVRGYEILAVVGS